MWIDGGWDTSPDKGEAMSTVELVEQLRHLSNSDRLALIEAASRLIRDELTAQAAIARKERSRRMQEAANALKDLYEPGGELTEWTSLDGEEILDDYFYCNRFSPEGILTARRRPCDRLISEDTDVPARPSRGAGVAQRR